jgi:diaminohydroxyphosphoribosylaminopyrimidine deaminase/5-amino-6-(5-phosphoribosylamino)uracil reductase
VTLEPCSHIGRTAPCCDALINTGIARVVYAMQDPNPQVAGQGLARLKQAGIEVTGPLLESEALELNKGFIKRMTSGLPYVRCKLAMSLDGRTAMASGESQWITGAAARSDVQRLRAKSCAVVTGIDSILLDDSSLTVRATELGLAADAARLAADKQPLRVVLDSQQRLSDTAKALADPSSAIVVSCGTEHQSLTALGVTQWQMTGEDGRIDLDALLRKLADQQCNEVLVEAGSTLAGAFVAAGLVDELIVYMAPALMGSSARPLLDLPIDTMAEKKSVVVKDIRSIGDDWRITATFSG